MSKFTFKPFLTLMQQGNFPLSHLPSSIYDACADAQAATQAPAELIIAQCLGVAAAACQGNFDVELPHGQRTPCSLDLITLGESGERKSTVNQLLAAPLFEYQRTVDERLKQLLQQYFTDREAWLAQQKGILKALEKAAQKGDCTAQLKEKLAAHSHTEPVKPKVPKILYDQFTPAGFIRGMSDNHAVSLILSDEAGAFFAHPRIGEIPTFNSLWNGSDIRKDDAGTGMLNIPSPRVSLSLQMQPDYFFKAKERYSLELRESGFLARCLVSFPPSTQGYRFANDQPTDKEGLDKFHKRIRELLESAFPDEGTQLADRQCLRFSDQAKVELRQLAGYIESSLQSGSFLCSMRDFASKVGEHVCRLAAIFHIVENKPGLTIDCDDVSRASQIIEWFAKEFDQIIVRSMAPSPEEQDAQSLLAWFQMRLPTHGNRWYTITELNKNGPHKMRNNGRMIEAVKILVYRQLLGSWTIPPKSPRGRVKITYGFTMDYPLQTAYPNTQMRQQPSTYLVGSSQNRII